MTWRMVGWSHWSLYAAGVDPDARDAEGCGPVPAGELGHIDGRWYGVPTGTLVQDPDGWHVPTFDDPASAAAHLGTVLGGDVPPLPEAQP